MISQIRNNLLLDAQEEYNCSLADIDGVPVDWDSRGDVHFAFGLFCIAYAFVAIPFYFTCARIIWSMRKAHTYKIMVFLAVSDIGELFCNSLAFGILLMNGEVYCKHPKLNFVYAIGSKTWYLLTLPFGYALFSALFTPLFFFDSITHTVQVNPRITDKYEYNSYFHIFNNVMNPIVTFILYFIMLLSVMTKFGKLTIQSTIVITIHMSTCIVYEIIQFIDSTHAILYAAHVGWMLIHGIPPVIYMLFNSSIRKAMLRLGGTQSRVTVLSLSHPTTQRPAPPRSPIVSIKITQC
ncbi:hypothetical protein PRIPAC_77451 [Pristionchus pacificus]|uniref:G protein-coupled receptor n=1 Tax=Pristionchus pacificus TaxID=54126 RepID=A0A2A6CN89_PRIPA|nr:hypothetical protein PRIPAC_77451 [Pristionchus pacificus]|eukprot:PDM79664.1 G protein-coupled receptor [Pristionchus pacificus]